MYPVRFTIMPQVTAWIVTDGGAGFEVQALGVAEALGAEPVVKRVKQNAPWSWVAPWGPVVDVCGLTPPWPDLVIAAGRQSIPFARMIRRRSKGQCFVAVLQNPRVPTHWFDFVWAPEHDRLAGSNVMSTLLSPHRVTPARLASEAEKIAADISPLPHPRIAVLVGGTNAIYRFDEAAAEKIGDAMAGAARQTGGSLLVTPSRRTGAAQTNIIRERIKDVPHRMWDGEGYNPYFAFLGSADAVLVTCDSVNMVGEAIGTGKPVYVIPLEGNAAKREHYFNALYEHGVARPFRGTVETGWSYAPLDATRDIAAAIARALAAHRSAGS